MAGQAATYTALVTASLTVGYWAGTQWSRYNVTSSSSSAASSGQLEETSEKKASLKKAQDSDSEYSDSEEGDPEENLGAVRPDNVEDCKLVLVVRTDLGMSPGKIAAQCSHATLACYKALSKSNPTLLRHWEKTGQTKVALRGNNEEELDTLEALARSLNLCARSIHDAGRTQIAAGSRTVLGIGPGPTKLVNQVTGKLRLL